MATIVVTRIGGTAGDATVGYAVTSGSAPNPAGSGDYDATSGLLTFAASEESKSFTIAIHDDGTPDTGALSVDLALEAPGNGLALGARTTATLWIVRE